MQYQLPCLLTKRGCLSESRRDGEITATAPRVLTPHLTIDTIRWQLLIVFRHVSLSVVGRIMSDYENESVSEPEEITDLSNPAVVLKYKTAAEIVNKSLKGVLTQVGAVVRA